MTADRTDHVLAAIDGALDDWVSPDAMRWTPEPPRQVTATATVTFDSRDALARAVAAEIGPPYAVRDVVLPPLDWTDVRSFEALTRASRARPLHRVLAEAIVRAGRDHIMERYTHRERLEVRISPVDAPRNDDGEPVGGVAYGHPLVLDAAVMPGTMRLIDLDLAERDRAVAEARSQGRRVAWFDPDADAVRVFG